MVVPLPPSSSHPNALLIAGEISRLLASIRSSKRWASSGNRFTEEEVEDDISESLKSLRRDIFAWEDWSFVEPLEYLIPFLEVVKSPETTAVVTDIALTSILVFLNILGDSSTGIYDAIQSIAESVTQCKFEATYPAFDECVLNRILDVLVGLVRSCHGCLLAHDNLINIFQACYRIGHYQTEKGRETSEMLTQSSRRAMHSLVSTIFSRLDELAAIPAKSGKLTPVSMMRLLGRQQNTTERRLQVSPSILPEISTDDFLKAADADAGNSNRNIKEGATSTTSQGNKTHINANTEHSLPQNPDDNVAAATSKPNQILSSQDDGTTTFGGPPATQQHHNEIVSVLSPAKTASQPEGQDHHSMDAALAALTPVLEPNLAINTSNNMDHDADAATGYGIEALAEVLSFIISFVAAPRTRHHGDIPSHGLDLAFAALVSGRSSFEQHEPLMALLQEDLVKSMFIASKSPSLSCLSGICRVSLALYVHLGRHFLLQIEALLGLLLLPLAEGRGTATAEHQQVALEGIVDFCCQPSFVLDMYVNLDCRVERMNLLEQICTLLSKAAFPVHDSLTPMHVLSLDGIMSILSSLAIGLARTTVTTRINSAGVGVLNSTSVSHPSTQTGSLIGKENMEEAANRDTGADNHHVLKSRADAEFVDIWTPLSLGKSPPVLDAILFPEEASPDHIATAAAKEDGSRSAVELGDVNGGDGADGHGELLAAREADRAALSSPLSSLPTKTIAPSVARAEKILKARLASVAEHFNRDQKKGFKYAQSIGLLPSTLDPGTVARFLRCCPGLAKPGIGEILGERDTFYDGVRDAFIETFDFAGLRFDVALRLFMDAFRPPGEGQKIDRIMQVFGKRYYEQVPDAGLKNADAAYVLAYSVIMLNTDLHNTQNKKKMSLEDFARINRSTNDGDPMPPELLSNIYAAISQDELKISSECSTEDLPHQSVFWMQMLAESQKPRGKMLLGATADPALERDIFCLVWGPTLAAASVILDRSFDDRTARRAIDGLALAAQLGSRNGVDGIADQLLGTLAKYTSVFNASLPRAVLTYGASEKTRAAYEATFSIADSYGDGLKAGWRTVLDCTIRLYKAGLLPASVILADGESLEDAESRMPQPLLASAKSKGSSGSLFSRAITSLILMEGSESGANADVSEERQKELMEKALQSAEACRVNELIADSKFMTGDALVEFLKAIMWSGGNIVAAARTGDGSDTAELALELLITLALRNRDRVSLIWPLVHEYLAACTAADTAEETNPLVERAVLGLLRVCQRLLPYKEDTAEMLLSSLRLIVGLAPAVGWALAERIAQEILLLLSSSGPYIKSEADWRTIASIIRLTAARAEAAPAAFEALSVSCRSADTLSAQSYMPLLEVCLQLIDRFKGNSPEAAARVMDCAELLFSWLPSQGSADDDQGGKKEKKLSDEAVMDLWLTSVGVMSRGLCKEEVQVLRDTSVATLHRVLLASTSLHLPPEVWVQTFRELLIPLIVDLAKLAANKKAAKTRPGLDKTVRLAVNMLTKVLLQYAPLMATDRDFYALWENALSALHSCMLLQHEGILESVPENTKNMLLVLGASGILNEEWKDAERRSLWTMTWSIAGKISPELTPAILNLPSSEDVKTSDGHVNADGAPAAEQLVEKQSVGQEAGGDSEKIQEQTEEEEGAPGCKQS